MITVMMLIIIDHPNMPEAYASFLLVGSVSGIGCKLQKSFEFSRTGRRTLASLAIRILMMIIHPGAGTIILLEDNISERKYTLFFISSAKK